MEYEVPEELAVFIDKMLACEVLISLYVKLPFGFRKARKCATDKQYFHRKFWNGFNEIHPELNDKKLSYSATTKKVREVLESEDGAANRP